MSEFVNALNIDGVREDDLKRKLVELVDQFPDSPLLVAKENQEKQENNPEGDSDNGNGVNDNKTKRRSREKRRSQPARRQPKRGAKNDSAQKQKRLSDSQPQVKSRRESSSGTDVSNNLFKLHFGIDNEERPICELEEANNLLLESVQEEIILLCSQIPRCVFTKGFRLAQFRRLVEKATEIEVLRDLLQTLESSLLSANNRSKQWKSMAKAWRRYLAAAQTCSRVLSALEVLRDNLSGVK
mmetsp:Transcript_11696/g.12848  ORF Transcript_11696/g.12848 Transcript_11696/m.12848 type:complete len:241 (+) Transcript_11696:1408-2130(+)